MTAVPAPDPLVTPLPGGMVLVGPRGSRRLLSAVYVLAEVEERRNGATPADLLTLRAALEVAAEQARRNTAEAAEYRAWPAMSSPRRSSSSTVGAGSIGTREAARLLGCTDRNVRALCRRGVFDSAVRRAGTWWMERSEVAARITMVRAPRRHVGQKGAAT